MSYRRSRSLGRYDDDSGDDRDTVKERKGGISSRTGAQRPSSKFTLPETFEVGSDQLSVQEVLDLYDRREITGDTKIIPAGFYPTILSLILKDLEGMALENGGRDDARSDRKQQETKRAPVKAGRDDTIEKRGSAEDDDNGPPLRRSMRGPFADDNRGQGVRNRGAPPRGPEDEDDIWAGGRQPGGRAGARPPGRDRADGPRGRDESVGGRAPRSVSRGRSYYDDEEEEEPPGRYSNGRSYGNRSNGHNGRGGWEEGGYDQRSRGYGNRNGNGRGGRGGGGGGGYGGGYGDRPYNSDYGGRGRGYGGGAGGNYGGGGGRFGGNRRY